MIQKGFLLLLFIAAVTSAPAPAVKKVACVKGVGASTNFNATLFSGIWYEVRNYFPSPGREGTCKTAKFTDNKDDTLRLDLGWVDTKNVIQRRTGTVKPAGAQTTDAQLSVTLEKKTLIYTIFYLSYDKFYGVYACVDNKADVWIYARQREVTLAQLQGTIYAFLHNKYPTLSAMKLSLTSQKGCKAVV